MPLAAIKYLFQASPPWLGDGRTLALLSVVLVLLAIATLVGTILRRRPDSAINPALLAKFNLRVRAWWLMGTILVASFLLGYVVTVILFGVVSFWRCANSSP